MGRQSRSDPAGFLAATPRSLRDRQGAENTGGSAPTTHSPSLLGIALQKLIRSAEALLAGEGIWQRKGSISRRPNPQCLAATPSCSLVTDFSISLCFGEAPALLREVPWFVFRNPAVSLHLDRFKLQHSAVRVVWLPFLLAASLPDREAQAVEISARLQTGRCARRRSSTGTNALL